VDVCAANRGIPHDSARTSRPSRKETLPAAAENRADEIAE
jgi:hypothetical protein